MHIAQVNDCLRYTDCFIFYFLHATFDLSRLSTFDLSRLSTFDLSRLSTFDLSNRACPRPLHVRGGIGYTVPTDGDLEGRVMTVEYDVGFVVNVYTPNSGAGLKRLGFRTSEWDQAFAAYVRGLEKIKPVIVIGKDVLRTVVNALSNSESKVELSINLDIECMPMSRCFFTAQLHAQRV